MSASRDHLLLAETRRFCEVEFDVPPYVELDTRDKKVNRIAINIGGLASYVVLVGLYRNPKFGTKVVGDLGMYRSMLLYEFDVVEPSRGHITPGEAAIDYLASALSGFKNYLEPREHGESSDYVQITEVVIPNLQATIDVLSERWQVDPIAAHLNQIRKPELGLVFPDQVGS